MEGLPRVGQPLPDALNRTGTLSLRSIGFG